MLEMEQTETRGNLNSTPLCYKLENQEKKRQEMNCLKSPSSSVMENRPQDF